MGKINVSRVFLGGIVAGAVSLALQGLAVVAGFTQKLAEAANIPALAHPPVESQLTIALVELLVGGPLAIWFYAAIRPRFGPGPKTAMYTALWIWFVLGPYEQTVLTAFGFVVPITALVMMDAFALPAIAVSVLLGAWVYKEE